MDKGFGTAYEKQILGKIFADLVNKYKIKTVCEFPSNDLMDNNSSEFETLGCSVTRQSLTDVDSSEKYDLVWCFCEVEQQENPLALIETMIEKSKRYILIITQNKRNIGVPLHYIYHFFARKKWDHGHYKYMTTAIVEKEITGKNVSIVYRGAFDAPWFILDVYEAGTLLLRLIPKSLIGSKIKQNKIKESFFEKLPYGKKKWLSHHVYVLIDKNQSSFQKSHATLKERDA